MEKKETFETKYPFLLAYEQSAAKLVVRVLRSGNVLYKTQCAYMNGEGLLSMGFQYLSRITHVQLSKAANRIEYEIGCVV